MSEVTLSINGFDPIELYGAKNVRLKILKDAFSEVSISSRGEMIKLSGEKKQTQKVKSKLEIMMRI